MRELQNPFIHKTMKKSAAKISAVVGLQLLLVCSVCGCVTKIRDSVQELPQTIALANHNANDNDYPDLSKIPPIPSNMRTDADWSIHKNNLELGRIEVEKSPNSRPPLKQEADMSWAQSAKNVLETDPRAQPAKPEEDAMSWVARMRALLNIPNEPATNK